MTPNVLVDLQFQSLLSEASAQTASGHEVLAKYQSYLLGNPVSCGIVNSFIKESAGLTFDSGVKRVLETTTDYINENRISWMIASACESINENGNSRNYLNRNAAAQAAKLLEQDEENVVKYIRAGALKNIMFCEAFRSIAAEVFKNSTKVIENHAEYTRLTPISMVESGVNGEHYFVVRGRLFERSEEGVIVESQDWQAVSDTFKTVESLLESNLVTVDEENVYIKYNNQEYTISEAGKIKHGDKEMSVAEMREENQLYLRVANPSVRRTIDQVLEAIAITAENYDHIATLENVGIYTTKGAQFLVIESNENLIAEAIYGPSKWAINENAMKALDFIKSKVNVDLNEQYKGAIEKAITEADKESREEMQKTLENNDLLSIKERISLLTEKFKNDPAKLAVLSKLAEEVSNI